VGRTHWSARVPLDPLFRSKNRGFQLWRQADEGVGRGPGSAPQLMQVFGHGKSKWHWAILPAAAKINRPTVFDPAAREAQADDNKPMVCPTTPRIP